MPYFKFLLLAGLVIGEMAMATESEDVRMRLYENLSRYSELVDGSAEPERIPSWAVEYDVMEWRKMIIALRRKTAEQGTSTPGESQNPTLFAFGSPGPNPELQAATLKPEICAEMKSQDATGVYHAERIANMFIASRENENAAKQRQTEAYENSLDDTAYSEFWAEVEKHKPRMQYEEIDFIGMSRDIPDMFIVFVDLYCDK
jgi:hypothetical protein